MLHRAEGDRDTFFKQGSLVNRLFFCFCVSPSPQEVEEAVGVGHGLEGGVGDGLVGGELGLEVGAAAEGDEGALHTG